MDETGMPLCPRPPKVVARKGQKKVRYQTLGQKSQVTILACGSATGQIIPPFMIFAVKQISPLWTPDKVSGSRFAVSDSGWVDQELFNFWLTDHFLPNVPSLRPVLLLLDGHSSNFEPYSIQFAREHQIVIFCLPLHSTHECQPLDTSFFRSLKSHWQNSVYKFYQDNSGKSVSKLNFCSVLKLGRNKNVCKEKKKKLKKVPRISKTSKKHPTESASGRLRKRSKCSTTESINYRRVSVLCLCWILRGRRRYRQNLASVHVQ